MRLGECGGTDLPPPAPAPTDLPPPAPAPAPAPAPTDLPPPTSVETIRLLQNPVISDVWKYFAVVVGIFTLNIPFPMSIICGGFPTNLMHVCNVISRPNKIQRKY